MTVVPFPISRQVGLLDELRRETEVPGNAERTEMCRRACVKRHGLLLGDWGVEPELIKQQMQEMEMAFFGYVSKPEPKKRKAKRKVEKHKKRCA